MRSIWKPACCRAAPAIQAATLSPTRPGRTLATMIPSLRESSGMSWSPASAIGRLTVARRTKPTRQVERDSVRIFEGREVTDALQDHQLRTGDESRQLLAEAERRDQVLLAGHDDRRHLEPG